MKRIIDNEILMQQICEMYYNQNLTQGEIGKQLKLSRPTISKMLIDARKKGIVRIIIADTSGRNYTHMEEILEKRFNLKKVIVTKSHEDKEANKNEMGRAAAKYLERILGHNHILGISMGSTLTYIMPHLHIDYLKGIHVIPLVGGISPWDISIHANDLAENLAKSLKGQVSLLPAPAMVSRAAVKDQLLKEKSIASILNMVSSLDIALCGIGAPHESSTLAAAGYISKEMLQSFTTKDVAGDICMNFFDNKGDILNFNTNQKMVSINIEKLRKVPWSIGIAGGAHKADAIAAALKGRYINVLVTDYECGKLISNK